MTRSTRASFAVVVSVATSACSGDASPKVEPSPFDGKYLCTEFLQTCVGRDLQGSIEYPATAQTEAPGELAWLETGCHISHDLMGTEATLIGSAQICRYDFVANLTKETLVSRLSFMVDASEVTWYAHQIDSDGCEIFHNATCTRMP